MNSVTVCKAIGKGVPIASIRVNGTLPSSVASSQVCFELDARKIVETLKASLPGGTLDAVLRLLLTNRASGLVVPTP